MKRTAKICIIAGALLLVSAGVAFWAWRNLDAIVQRVAGYAIERSGQQGAAQAAALVPTLFGFNEPHTILFLFLNNTEMRPGGGFIGTAATVTFDRGQMTRSVYAGSEIIDVRAPSGFVVPPPTPLKTYLGVDRWYFRDANWSPDFAVSARRALQFYAASGGVDTDHIDSVIGITPEVVSDVLAATGPVTVRGVTYTADAVRDLLEYEVEIGYQRNNVPKAERKMVIQELAGEIGRALARTPSDRIGQLIRALFERAQQRHLMLFSTDSPTQQNIEALGWSGRLRHGDAADWLMLVDANLTSWKTDRVMKRHIVYSVWKDAKDGLWHGRVEVKYEHSGGNDWRTRRYQAYTRLFVPLGTVFVKGAGAEKAPKESTLLDWNVQEEEGATSIGALIRVPPGEQRIITYDLLLSPSVAAALEHHEYNLIVQKQSGLPQFDLTLRHDFGTSIERAEPPEAMNNFGDQYYYWSGTLTKDLDVYVRTKDRN